MGYVIEGVRQNAAVHPVRADFSYTVTNKLYPQQPPRTVNRIGYAYFYLDQFQHWNFTWYAHAGTR